MSDDMRATDRLQAWIPDADGADFQSVSEAMRAAYQHMPTGQIEPAWTLDETKARIRDISFESELSLADAIREVSELMEHGDLRSAGARCFGYFNPTPAWPGVLADAIASARNPQACLTTHAPASVYMERHVIDWMLVQIGFPSVATGHFTSGGSEANATALNVALVRSHDDYVTQGARCFTGQPVLYASSESHLAWIKIAKAAGLGTESVRLVPTNGKGQMDLNALESHIEKDRSSGDVPVMVAATAGTTNAGEIDDLHGCRAIADVANVHLHVDAAWAGALVVDPRRRSLLSGIDDADSITIDAHKWLSVPMGAGMVFVRDTDAVQRAYAVRTGYMPDGDGADPYITSNQWSRRFVGLRLWMILRTGGARLYRELFSEHFELARRLRHLLEEQGWVLENDSPLPVVLFNDASGTVPAHAIAHELNRNGQAWLGTVQYEGKDCLRACLTSFLSDESSIDLLLAELARARTGVHS